MGQSGPHLFSKKQPSSQNVSARSDAILFHDLCVLAENYHIIAFQHAQFPKIPLKAFPSRLCSVFWCCENISIRFFCILSLSLFLVSLLLHLILVGTLVLLPSHFWHVGPEEWANHFCPKLPGLTAGSASRCSTTGHSSNTENIGNIEKAWSLIVRSSFYLNHVASLSAVSRWREWKEVDSAVAVHASGTQERSWKFSAVSPLSAPACAACSGNAVIVGMKSSSVLLCFKRWENSTCVFIFVIVSWSATLFFPILWLIEIQIVAEETARRLISVLCNEADGRRRPTSDCCEQHPAAADIKANTDI